MPQDFRITEVFRLVRPERRAGAPNPTRASKAGSRPRPERVGARPLTGGRSARGPAAVASSDSEILKQPPAAPPAPSGAHRLGAPDRPLGEAPHHGRDPSRAPSAASQPLSATPAPWRGETTTTRKPRAAAPDQWESSARDLERRTSPQGHSGSCSSAAGALALVQPSAQLSAERVRLRFPEGAAVAVSAQWMDIHDWAWAGERGLPGLGA